MLVDMTAGKGGLCCAFFQQQSGKVRARQADRYPLAPGDVCVYCMYYDTSSTQMRCCCWLLDGSYPVIFGREESQRFLSAED
jgi:hypothetical protein